MSSRVGLNLRRVNGTVINPSMGDPVSVRPHYFDLQSVLTHSHKVFVVPVGCRMLACPGSVVFLCVAVLYHLVYVALFCVVCIYVCVCVYSSDQESSWTAWSNSSEDTPCT